MSGSTGRGDSCGRLFLGGKQELFRRQAGVLSTGVGYTGGDVPNPGYRNHGSHAEAIEIVFDPHRVSYRRLLEVFFQTHDPTTLNRQGNDHGTSYRPVIFDTSDEQRRIATEAIAEPEPRYSGASESGAQISSGKVRPDGCGTCSGDRNRSCANHVHRSA